MAYEPLHHKYRPQTFADLVGQDAIAQTLTNALQQDRIAPAYLLTGPRGTGKTSSARILAKSLNCLSSHHPTATPCGICDVCKGISSGATLDFIEIDAASNTGVDNIRELIERAQFAPVQCRYKVYVIDECHMLSVAAFNALLKTLEEPPNRVVFVLATTDPQRVLPTIISRCQRFDFRRIPLEPMVEHLRNIAQKEHINITLEAIQMVAQISQGGLRDAESLLDQLSLLAGEISVDKVWDLVGAVPERSLIELLNAVNSGDSTQVIDCARDLLNRGREPLILLQNLAGFYRDLLIAKTAPKRSDLVALTQPTWEQLCEFAKGWDMDVILAGQKHLKESEAQIKNTTQPRLWLEITLLGLFPSALKQTVHPVETAYRTQQTVSSSPVVPLPTPPPSPPLPQNTVPQNNASGVVPVSPPPESSASMTSPPIEKEVAFVAQNEENQAFVNSDNLEQIWQQVLKYIEPFSTQELLRQQGRLLSVTSDVVQIGIPPKWLKPVESKIAKIEAAFRKILNYAVKVRLSSGTNPTAFSTSIFQPSKSTQNVDSVPPKIEEESFSETADSPPIEPQIVNVPEPEPALVQTPLTASPGEATESLSMLQQRDRERVAIASQKLAQFFQGEIITLTPEMIAKTEVEETPISESFSKPTFTQEEEEFISEVDEESSEDDLPF